MKDTKGSEMCFSGDGASVTKSRLCSRPITSQGQLSIMTFHPVFKASNNSNQTYWENLHLNKHLWNKHQIK